MGEMYPGKHLQAAQPLLPVPAPLRGVEADSFARHTITVRLPRILREVIEQNEWPADARQRLQALLDEIPYGVLKELPEDGGEDIAAWNEALQPYLGENWLWAPWFVVETCFFRRILQATGYFQPGPMQGIDPYAAHKRNAQQGVIAPLRRLLGEMGIANAHQAADIAHLLRVCVWGNQADLSMWPSRSAGGPARPAMEQAAARLVGDDGMAAGAYLASLTGQGRGVDILLDNVGLELAYDLSLADWFLRNGLAATVRFHAKPYPTYVSDATIVDVQACITSFQLQPDPHAQQLGERLAAALADGRLQLTSHVYWTSPLAGWQMPADLRQELGQAALLISKGDANYRRWLGDRHWSFTAPLDQILAYFPTSWLALRVYKAELAAGLAPGVQAAMQRLDPGWLCNGRWGTLQFLA